MPDLNLIDEGGFEETPAAPAAPPAKKSVKKSSGGGGGKTILLIVVILCIAAAGVYFANQRGIIKLWGKKKPIVQVQEEQFPPETQSQPAQAQPQPDTSAVAMIETSPVEEKQAPAKESESITAEQSPKKTKTVKKSEPMVETESSSKLSEMSGEFTVQVIAYREKKKAEATAKNLEISGYPSFVEKIPMKGGEWYTVRIGRYSTRDEAKKAVESFAEELQAHYVIDKVRK
jgi:septal ring-binding cell division protein DamX